MSGAQSPIEIQETSKFCDALGNPIRYQIVMSLRNRAIGTCCDRIELYESGISVADVVKLTGLAQSTVSQHLKVLEQAGIIYREKRGSWTCFFLDDKRITRFLNQLQLDMTVNCSNILCTD